MILMGIICFNVVGCKSILLNENEEKFRGKEFVHETTTIIFSDSNKTVINTITEPKEITKINTIITNGTLMEKTEPVLYGTEYLIKLCNENNKVIDNITIYVYGTPNHQFAGHIRFESDDSYYHLGNIQNLFDLLYIEEIVW